MTEVRRDFVYPNPQSVHRTGPSIPDASHQWWEEDKDHVPWAAGNGLSHTAQDIIGLLCCKGKLLAYVKLAHQDKLGQNENKNFFCQASFKPIGPQPVLVLGLFLPYGRTWHFSFVELHRVPLHMLFLQLFQVLWIAAHPSGLANTTPSFLSSAALVKVHSISSSRSLVKKLKSTCPSIDPWGTSLVTVLQLDCSYSSINETEKDFSLDRQQQLWRKK